MSPKNSLLGLNSGIFIFGEFRAAWTDGNFSLLHLLDTKTAVAEGSYIGVDANGQKVLTRIPKFKMTVPE